MSKKSKEQTEDFVVKYVIPEEMHDRYVNGMWGGYAQDGMMNIHFYHERLPLPKKTFHSYSEDGSVDPVGRAEFGGDVVRILQASVIMDAHIARDLRDWLNEQLQSFEAEEGDDASKA